MIENQAETGKPENKSLPPRNDIETPGYSAQVLFNSESTAKELIHDFQEG